LNRGVDLDALRGEFTRDAVAAFEPAVNECLQQGLLEKQGMQVCLTDRGRLLSNEVFARFLMEESTVKKL
jgi:oxygen-independent coproporphyrinogen-3 oxidase